MTSQEIERDKRITNAAEALQAIFKHSKIAVCQNLQIGTEDCIPSCKSNYFSLITKF